VHACHAETFVGRFPHWRPQLNNPVAFNLCVGCATARRCRSRVDPVKDHVLWCTAVHLRRSVFRGGLPAGHKNQLPGEYAPVWPTPGCAANGREDGGGCLCEHPAVLYGRRARASRALRRCPGWRNQPYHSGGVFCKESPFAAPTLAAAEHGKEGGTCQNYAEGQGS